MSKERARARAEREQAAARQAELRARRDAVLARARARREARAGAWRRARLWQSAPGARRRREAAGLLITVLALCVFCAYLLTRSVTVAVGTALILLIVAPVSWALLHDRNSR